MTETINQRCARLCKEWETAIAEVRAGKLSPQVAGEAYDRYAAAMAERSAAQSGDTASASAAASATHAPATPTSSTAEIAARRRAETRDLWRRVVGQVNAAMFGRQTDSAPNASREGTSPHGKVSKLETTKYDSKAIWKRAVASANAGIAGSEPRERDASSSGRRKSGDFLERAMTAAGKHLANTGFSVAR